MDTAWLESFLTLIEHGGFTRAAEAQHLSQPAFSRRIRSLEQWCGAELVDRSTYPVSLTPAGVRIRAAATDTINGLGTARDEIRGRRTTPDNAVRIAASHTLATAYFSQWWSRLEPTPHCVLSPANTLEAYDALLHGGCDLLLAYADPHQPLGLSTTAVEWIELDTDLLAPYSGSGNAGPEFGLPGTPAVPVPFVAHGQGAFLGRVTESVTSRRQLHLRTVAQSDLTAAVASMIQQGWGVGWLPGLIATPGVAAGLLTRVGDDSLTAPLQIRLYRRRSERPSTFAALAWDSATGSGS